MATLQEKIEVSNTFFSLVTFPFEIKIKLYVNEVYNHSNRYDDTNFINERCRCSCQQLTQYREAFGYSGSQRSYTILEYC